jgi:SNF2 family DNA or RNA helicase
LDLLEVPINRRGWKYVRFDGSMNIADRNASVAAFTDDPDVRIMLVSLKAGNAGLNLVAASHVILFDPFWNPYVEDQAIDRAHRIGQKKEVFVHRLLIEGTVEDRIVELQNKKRELISGALDEGGTFNVSRLDTRELAYLFVSVFLRLYTVFVDIKLISLSRACVMTEPEMVNGS